MSTSLNKQVIDYLTKLQDVYKSLNSTLLATDIKQIEAIISDLQAINHTESKVIIRKQTKKPTFAENHTLHIEQQYEALRGVKLDYANFLSEDDVVSFIENTTRTKALRETTALDLKMLYSILTKDPNEIKGTKQQMYEAISRNIRAKKRGKAFMVN